MSLTARVKRVLSSKANRADAPQADPRLLLDESYERQVYLLQDVRRGLAEVSTAKKRIELQAAELRRLASEMVPIFASRHIHREALAALAFFRQAAETERACVEVVEKVAAYLRKARHIPDLRFHYLLDTHPVS